jgi:hypothetical protein
LQRAVDPAELIRALDAALSPGLDVLDAVPAPGKPALADLIEASRWRIELPGVAISDLQRAVSAFTDADEVLVERLTKQGMRTFDARAAVAMIEAGGRTCADEAVACAILDLVVRQVTPSVRPDDVLAGLRVVADLTPPVPPRATRLAQGVLTPEGEIVDPLSAGRDGGVGGGPSTDGAE